MAGTAISIGSLLFLLGPLFFFLGDSTHRSPTAFIASLFGIFIVAFGLTARNPARRKAAMHGAAGFGLLGILGSLRGLPVWPLLLTGRADGLTNSKILASWETLLMFVLCTLFVVLCGQSFIAARRAK